MSDAYFVYFFGAFLVQILLLSGRIYAVVLVHYSAVISVLFWCISVVDSTTSGLVYFGAVFGCNLRFGAVLITPRYSFRYLRLSWGSFRLQIWCSFRCILGAASPTHRYSFCGCSGAAFGCNFGAILVHLWCRFCDFTVYFLRLF